MDVILIGSKLFNSISLHIARSPASLSLSYSDDPVSHNTSLKKGFKQNDN